MKKVEAFKCDYCHRCFGRAVDAANHERYCNMNPDRKHCKTCAHFGYKTQRIDEYDQKFAYCLKLDIPMSDQPYYTECGCGYNYDGSEYHLPGTCEHYEQKSADRAD